MQITSYYNNSNKKMKGCARFMKMKLHELLKQLREERNWSLEDLSKKTQVGVEKLSMYEKGELTPSVQTILKLSNVLEVPASNLMDSIQR